MTTTHETLARPASLGNAATAIFALLGLIDVALAGVIRSPDAPPLIVSLGVAALGLITLLSLVSAAGQPRSADRGRGDPGHLGRARRARILPERAGLGHGGRGIRHRRHDHRPGPGAPGGPTARMRMPSPRRPPTATVPRRGKPALLPVRSPGEVAP